MHCHLCETPLLNKQQTIHIPDSIDERELMAADCCNECYIIKFGELPLAYNPNSVTASDQQYEEHYQASKLSRRLSVDDENLVGTHHDEAENKPSALTREQLKLQRDIKLGENRLHTNVDRRPRTEKGGIASMRRPIFGKQKQKVSFNDPRNMGGMSETKWYEYKLEKQCEAALDLLLGDNK